MPDVGEIMDAMATQIQGVLCGTADPLIEELQVYGRFLENPTPPAIDIYPADPFTVGLGFGSGNREFNFTVRARVTTADHEAGQDLLLSMMDPDAATSVAEALEGSGTASALVDDIAVVDGPTGFGVFPSTGPDGNLLGCTWTVRVLP